MTPTVSISQSRASCCCLTNAHPQTRTARSQGVSHNVSESNANMQPQGSSSRTSLATPVCWMILQPQSPSLHQRHCRAPGVRPSAISLAPLVFQGTPARLRAPRVLVECSRRRTVFVTIPWDAVKEGLAITRSWSLEPSAAPVTSSLAFIVSLANAVVPITRVS